MLFDQYCPVGVVNDEWDWRGLKTDIEGNLRIKLDLATDGRP